MKILPFIAFAFCGLTGVAAVAGCSYAFGVNYGPAPIQEQTASGLETEIKEEGVKIRKLSTTTDGDDVITTLSYEVSAETTPDFNGTIDERVTARAYYQKSKETASDVISVSIDEENKLIKINNLKHAPFSDVVVVEISSLADPDVKAFINCNYRKRLTDITLGTLDYSIGDDVNLIGQIMKHSNDFNVTPFTIDTDFTGAAYQGLFSASLKQNSEALDIHVLEGDETIGTGSWEDFNSDMSGFDLVQETLNEFIQQTQTSFKNVDSWTNLSTTFLTESEVWNLGDDTWHDFIKEYCQGSFKISFKLEGVTIKDPLTGSVTAGNTTNYINIKYDFSDFGIAPDNITVEDDSVDF